MANTVHPHFSQNVFLQQSHTPTKQQQNLGVWQDKRAESSARIASGQPALAATGGRAQQLKKDTPRSQNNHTAFQKKEQVTFWVRPIAKTILQRVAKSEKLTLSEAGAAIFERAIQQNIDMQYGALLQPIIEQSIQKEMRPIKYLTFLLVRVAFAGEQTRSLATNILGRQPGMTANNLNEILDASSEAAKGKITRRTPQLEEIIAEVERWFQKEDSKTHA
jgi:hypothetical protein